MIRLILVAVHSIVTHGTRLNCPLVDDTELRLGALDRRENCQSRSILRCDETTVGIQHFSPSHKSYICAIPVDSLKLYLPYRIEVHSLPRPSRSLTG